jgi:hypothetical protein
MRYLEEETESSGEDNSSELDARDAAEDGGSSVLGEERRSRGVLRDDLDLSGHLAVWVIVLAPFHSKRAPATTH